MDSESFNLDGVILSCRFSELEPRLQALIGDCGFVACQPKKKGGEKEWKSKKYS